MNIFHPEKTKVALIVVIVIMALAFSLSYRFPVSRNDRQSDGNKKQDIPNAILAVTFPIGGENICVGEPYDIHWEQVGLRQVAVNIVKDGVTTYRVGSTAAENGIFTWVAGSENGYFNMPLGEGYEIVLTGKTSNESEAPIQARSRGLFTLSSCEAPKMPTFEKISGYITAIWEDAFLRITEPNGGETLCMGADKNISWESTAFEYITLYVGQADSLGFELGRFPASFNERGLDNGQGTYVWKVGILPNGRKLREGFIYKMHVSGEYISKDGKSGMVVQDASDKVFSIINCSG